MSDRWWLVNGAPQPCPDLLVWARWFESSGQERIVARTELADGSIVVSTVFLGLDHNFTGRGRPVLWETLVFARDEQLADMARYTTRANAEAGHLDMVQRVTAQLAERHHREWGPSPAGSPGPSEADPTPS